jgi:hypothetical protein
MRCEVEDLGELLVDFAVHLDGRAVGNLHDNLFHFGLDLAQSLKCQLADHFRSNRSPHVNPIPFLAGLAVLPLGRVGFRLARSHIADIAQGSRSFFPELRHSLQLWLVLCCLDRLAAVHAGKVDSCAVLPVDLGSRLELAAADGALPAKP